MDARDIVTAMAAAALGFSSACASSEPAAQAPATAPSTPAQPAEPGGDAPAADETVPMGTSAEELEELERRRAEDQSAGMQPPGPGDDDEDSDSESSCGAGSCGEPQ